MSKEISVNNSANNLINNAAPTKTAPHYDFKDTLVASYKVNWRIEDIIGKDKKLDFTKPFMPESFARTAGLDFLNADEKRILNHVRGHAYLCIFGLVEEFILPFVLDHVRPELDGDDYRVRAFLQLASEEAKHIQLFKLFSEEFQRNFGVECAVIGPPAAIAEAVLAHQPLAVALAILHIEWMTQRHYVESVKDDKRLDAQFKNLLKNHWLEEAQHAKLDTLMVEAIADGMSADKIEAAVDDYLKIVDFLDAGMRRQTLFDLDSFERAANRRLSGDERASFIEVQHQANRWTYIGTGMTHPKFLETLEELSSEQRMRIEKIASAFC